MLRPFSVSLTLVCALAFNAGAETITLATYNVEHFESHFEAFRLSKQKEAQQPSLIKELVDALKRSNDEDNWEVARVITHKAFSPDVLVLQEGCSKSNLEFFNKRWLQNAYETVIVFRSNTDREQNLCMLLKPGFKVVQRKDQYYLEKDSVANERGERLFARGPAFALIETPGGYKCWVGVTHQKSKSDNSVEVTAWRNREAIRTHQIMRELAQEGPDDVILLGDMNDDIGVGEFEDEPQSGGDTIANLVGPAKDGFALVTEKLAQSGQNSYGGYWNPRFRGLIDHVVVTPSMKDQIEKVSIFYGSLAPAASDHFPVLVKVRCDKPATRP
jgi:endonuclease/exonuclease/phosphatase family metal-dependent hydrolase